MFEKLCFNCGGISDNPYPLCSSCLPEPLKESNCCRICGILTTEFVSICPSCRESSYSFIRNYSLFMYRDLPKEILDQYKFKKDYSFSKFYARYIIEYIKRNFSDPLICFVPTSFIKRKINNGYQLDPILKELKKMKLDIKPVLKKRHSKTQKKLNRSQRELNLLKSFYIKGRIPQNRDIVLIDDVFTTGATINMCASHLNIKGNNIYSITLYRD